MPSTLIAFPQTSTGIVMGAKTWLPLPTPPVPVVVPANAIPGPLSASAALAAATPARGSNLMPLPFRPGSHARADRTA